MARAGTTVGRVGVPHDAPVDAVGTFYRNVGMRGGAAPARAFDFATDLDDVADMAYLGSST